MYQNKLVTLAEMKAGQTGVVVEVLGGRGLIRRLDALNIRPGKKVTKLSSTLFRGPIMLRVNNSQVAVGFGMARKIIVEIEKSSATG
ncbi:MAG: ferrous iron transport protein A [Dehalococcoidia bacterium]|nr:ferrous iron transport protein A [Dehalococcoidia bacterium]RLC63908.1 MAG: ferrous iron transport protein A [Chloroflexota bacterium]